MVLVAGTAVPPSGAPFAAAAVAGCTPPSFSNLTITAANLYTPWSVPLLSAINDASFPTVSATGLPPGITLKDQTTTLTTGAGSVLHTWVLDGAPTQLGTYTITVTAQNSCGGASTVITLPINNTQTAAGTVSCPAGYAGAYPNCVSSSGPSVSFDQASLVATSSTAIITGTSRTSSVKLTVQTPNGITYSSETAPVGGGRWTIVLKNLTSGLYSLYLYDGNNSPLLPGSLTVTLPGDTKPAQNFSSGSSEPGQSFTPASAKASAQATRTSTFSCSNIPTTLKIGSRGSTVLALQKSLISIGALPSDSATGYFGQATNSAVARLCPSISATTVQTTTSLPACPKVAVPPCQHGTLVSLGADQNHCTLGYMCQQQPGSNCPSVTAPLCSGGTIVSSGTDINGCSTGYSCQKVSCPTVPQPTCAPGLRLVTGPDANGCATVSYCIDGNGNTTSVTGASSATTNNSTSIFSNFFGGLGSIGSSFSSYYSSIFGTQPTAGVTTSAAGSAAAASNASQAYTTLSSKYTNATLTKCTATDGSVSYTAKGFNNDGTSYEIQTYPVGVTPSGACQITQYTGPAALRGSNSIGGTVTSPSSGVGASSYGGADGSTGGTAGADASSGNASAADASAAANGDSSGDGTGGGTGGTY